MRQCLLSCGYSQDLLRSNLDFEGRAIPLVGFAQTPMDSRSACVAVVTAEEEPGKAVERLRPLGAPIVFACSHNMVQWWKQGSTKAEWLESIANDRVESFFHDHRAEFSPDSIYRAKTLGRVRKEFQLSFVDLGLMPLIEGEVGKALSGLIERCVSELKTRLGWQAVTDEQGHWLLKSVFWLLSGKILRDKNVPTFEDVELANIKEVFSRVVRHYGTEPFAAHSPQTLEALEDTALTIGQFSSLALTTTESLAYVYESTLISKETRASLGTHSTPSYLVDYIVGELADWIAEIPEKDRSVFEPACGHAAFLVSAMRLLTQLLPPQRAVPLHRGPYLRKRLHGTERDSFALELARLSLTLTDIPNPDGWDLRPEDMFIANRLAEQARGNTILLANPPFERFTDNELGEYSKSGATVIIKNKACEMLRRTLPELQPGSVFGLVIPQTLLHASFAKDLRRDLIEGFELREVSLFPDKVFQFSDAESAILLGRRRPQGARSQGTLRYRWVREWQMPEFRKTYNAPSTQTIDQSRFNAGNRWDMRVPDLEEVWHALAGNPRANDLAAIGKGLDFRGKDLPPGVLTYSETPFPGAAPGYVRLERGLLIHRLPRLYWMNITDDAVATPRTGTTLGVPQVLMGYARVSRGPWRLKAFIDPDGRPVTSRFITARPQTCSLESLWALLNSPVANAYMFAHSGKRDNLVGEVRRIPMPQVNDFEEIETLVRMYLDAATDEASPNDLQDLLLRIDAAVLRQYMLPVEMEHALLSLFSGWPRAGVPFQQTRYLPQELSHEPIHFHNFMNYEKGWLDVNRRRGELIDKEIKRAITDGEAEELAELQAYAEYYLETVSPRPTKVLELLESHVLGIVTTQTRDDS